MTTESILQILLTAIVIIPLLFVIIGKLRLDVAAMIMAALLGILQLLGYGMLGPAGSTKDAVNAISGFGQPIVITLISLFIATHALEKSGVTRWIAQLLIRIGGKRENVFIGLFALTTAVFSLFMNNLAAGALMLPGAMEVCRRTGIKPSKLLIPVAYGSLLGGSATYFTTANIITSGLLQIANPPQRGLNILDFTPTGGLIALVGVLFLFLFGSRLLPDREPTVEQSLARKTGSELEDVYKLGERLWKTTVPAGNSFIGQKLQATCIGEQWGVVIAAVRNHRRELILPDADHLIQAGDELFLVGHQEQINALRATGLEIQPAPADMHLSASGITFAEVLLAPHSNAEGQTLKSLDFRRRTRLTAAALHHLDRSYRTNIGNFPLTAGDSLLVIGSSEQIQQLKRNPDFITIESNPGDLPINKRATLISLGVIFTAIGASIAGVPVYLCMLVAAIIMILSKIMPMEEAYRAVEWQAIFLVAGMYAVSIAMVQTGLANRLGNLMIDLVKPLGPLGLAAGAFILTGLLTQVMGGQVTALVTAPITISAAISMGVNPQAVAVATAIGCSATFLTPMAHPVNILMIAPANYQFKDFFKVGWMLTLVCFAALIAGMLLFWGL